MKPEDILNSLAEQGCLRTLPRVEIDGIYLYHQGRKYLNLSSNDYLGIAAGKYHKSFMESVCSEARSDGRFLLSNPSSRLVTGNSGGYDELEEAIGGLYGRRALVLGSGYLLNSGILPAITGKEDIILTDKYVHASIIDGLRLCPAPWHRYAHNDMDHLESLIKKFRDKCRELYIVTESLFSMDGDTAPLSDIVRLKEKYECKIYLDEAHAFGVRGNGGRGIADEQGVAGKCDILVATLGKAAASQGAFVVTDDITRELLVNRMRTLIFSTALPPISLMWSKYVISLLPQLQREREKLRKIEQIMGAGSHIVPVIAGTNEAAIELSGKMREAGFWVTPIRYPTVPKGAARVRLSLTAALPEEEITKLAELCSV